MASGQKPLCVEIEEQELRVLQIVDAVDREVSLTLKEVVLELERLRQRAADLQTANDLRAALIARQRGRPVVQSQSPQEAAPTHW